MGGVRTTFREDKGICAPYRWSNPTSSDPLTSGELNGRWELALEPASLPARCLGQERERTVTKHPRGLAAARPDRRSPAAATPLPSLSLGHQ